MGPDMENFVGIKKGDMLNKSLITLLKFAK